jgi:hypothetical protein
MNLVHDTAAAIDKSKFHPIYERKQTHLPILGNSEKFTSMEYGGKELVKLPADRPHAI